MHRAKRLAALFACIFVSILCVVSEVRAAAPETLGVFDWRTNRFSLFKDQAGGAPFATLDVVRRGHYRVFPIAGDWDGDGVTDLGWYDPVLHEFELLLDRKDGVPDVRVHVATGRPWLRPVVGDWDGDHKADLGLYDPLERRIMLLSPSRDGSIFRVLQLGPRREFDLRPFAGDWDGDGVDELGLYDQDDRTIHLLPSKGTGGREVVLHSNERSRRLRPVALDLSGTGRDGLALYDPETGHVALLSDLKDGLTDAGFNVTGLDTERLWPVAGRWTAPPALGGASEVPDTAYCRPVSAVDPAGAAFEMQLLALVNARRAAGASCGQQGVFPPATALNLKPALRCSARLHAQDMAAHDLLGQVGSDHSIPETRISPTGYAFNFVGETVAAGLGDPVSVVNAWMADDLSCSQLLEPVFQDAGAGFAATTTGHGTYWVLDLGAP